MKIVSLPPCVLVCKNYYDFWRENYYDCIFNYLTLFCLFLHYKSHENS